MFMKKQILSAICLLIAPIALYAAQPLDRVVAIVNDDVITQRQLDRQVDTVEKEMHVSNTPIPAKPQLEKQVLNQMIDQQIELQMAKRYGMDITEDELNRSINTIAARNHATVAQLRDAITAQGINWADYRKQIGDQMLINKVLDRVVASDINISDQDVKNIMNSADYQNKDVSEYQVGDILLALPEEPTSTQLHQAEQQAQVIMNKLAQGANFKAIAAESSNSETALNGGDLGWKSISELPSVFADRVKVMKLGQVEGPIRTGNGLHIIKLMGVKQNQAKHYLTQTHARHILIAVKDGANDKAARAQAEAIREQLLKGANFTDLAKKYSQDPGSAVKGGDLGWVPPGVMVAPFETAMDALKIDQISQPVKTNYGWHIIEVLGRKQVEDTEQYRKVQARQMIFQRKFQDQVNSWVERMKDASYIKVMLNNNA